MALIDRCGLRLFALKNRVLFLVGCRSIYACLFRRFKYCNLEFLCVVHRGNKVAARPAEIFDGKT